MKKIICFALILMFLIGSLCACTPTIVDQGEERVVLSGSFAIIEERTLGNSIVYDKDTTIVYYLEHNGYQGHLSPYLIYQDGYVYGAIFQDGEIKPVPYASAPLE